MNPGEIVLDGATRRFKLTHERSRTLKELFVSRGASAAGAIAALDGVDLRIEPGEAVGDDYVRLSGTSMAAPHVAGAAAVLLERFPTMRPAQLKAALVGAATPSPTLGVHQQGGGRLDVGRAVTQTVTAETPSGSMNTESTTRSVRWPTREAGRRDST